MKNRKQVEDELRKRPELIFFIKQLHNDGELFFYGIFPGFSGNIKTILQILALQILRSIDKHFDIFKSVRHRLFEGFDTDDIVSSLKVEKDLVVLTKSFCEKRNQEEDFLQTITDCTADYLKISKMLVEHYIFLKSFTQKTSFTDKDLEIINDICIYARQLVCNRTKMNTSDIDGFVKELQTICEVTGNEESMLSVVLEACKLKRNSSKIVAFDYAATKTATIFYSPNDTCIIPIIEHLRTKNLPPSFNKQCLGKATPIGYEHAVMNLRETKKKLLAQAKSFGKDDILVFSMPNRPIPFYVEDLQGAAKEVFGETSKILWIPEAMAAFSDFIKKNERDLLDQEDGVFLFIDFGGFSIDYLVIKMLNVGGTIQPQILEIDGSINCGGARFEKEWLETLEEKVGKKSLNFPEDLAKLEAVKINFYNAYNAKVHEEGQNRFRHFDREFTLTVKLELSFAKFDLKLNLDYFFDFIEPLLSQLECQLEFLYQRIDQKYGIKSEDITAVVLSGGAANTNILDILMSSHLYKNLYPKRKALWQVSPEKLHLQEHPETSVVRGLINYTKENFEIHENNRFVIPPNGFRYYVGIKPERNQKKKNYAYCLNSTKNTGKNVWRLNNVRIECTNSRYLLKIYECEDIKHQHIGSQGYPAEYLEKNSNVNQIVEVRLPQYFTEIIKTTEEITTIDIIFRVLEQGVSIQILYQKKRAYPVLGQEAFHYIQLCGTRETSYNESFGEIMLPSYRGQLRPKQKPKKVTGQYIFRTDEKPTGSKKINISAENIVDDVTNDVGELREISLDEKPNNANHKNQVDNEEEEIDESILRIKDYVVTEPSPKLDQPKDLPANKCRKFSFDPGKCVLQLDLIGIKDDSVVTFEVSDNKFFNSPIFLQSLRPRGFEFYTDCRYNGDWEFNNLKHVLRDYVDQELFFRIHIRSSKGLVSHRCISKRIPRKSTIFRTVYRIFSGG